MRLSKRIYKLAELVHDGDSVADIGTDHGYVPMLLIKQGKSPRVIMSDISEGSLSKAKETFKISQLSDRVDPSDFRVGDGLETIDKGEVDEIIIGGLGGHTIAQILDADIEKSRSFRRLILQPRKHSGSLRYYLYTHGWDIESESLAEEGKFACEIITAVNDNSMIHTKAKSTDAGSTEKASRREAPYPENDIRWKYPPYIMDVDPELARKRIEWKIGSIEEQIKSMSSADSTRDSTNSSEIISSADSTRDSTNSSKIMALNDDRDYLVSLLDCRIDCQRTF